MECARTSVGPRSTDPFANETSILPSSQMPIGATPALEQALTRFPPAHSQIVIELLPCELSQLEADRPTRFPLPDRRPVDTRWAQRRPHRGRRGRSRAACCSMARLNSARSRACLCNCSLARINHTCPGRKGGFDPASLPLFHACRRGVAIGDEGLLSFMVSLPFERPPSLRRLAPDHRFRGSFRVGFAVVWLLATAAAPQNVTRSSPRQRHAIAMQ